MYRKTLKTKNVNIIEHHVMNILNPMLHHYKITRKDWIYYNDTRGNFLARQTRLFITKTICKIVEVNYDSRPKN